MQTLKTAAIVVMIMTVLYSAYVSLTTPPEPLPEEIENMLVETGDFDIEDGFPSPSEMFAMGDVEPEGMTSESTGGDDSFAVPSFDIGPNNFGATAGTANVPLTGSKPANAPKAPSNAFGTPSNPIAIAASPSSLPPATENGIAMQQLDPGLNYPSTNAQFAIPDPKSVTSVFDNSSGTAFSIDDSGTAQITGARNASASLTDRPNSVATASMTRPADATVTTASATTTATDSLGKSLSQNSAPNVGLANAIQTADKQYKADQRKEALATLSLFYSTPGLSPSDRDQLLSRLDPLAGEVIYSRRHLTEQPHRVGHNETLMEIAARYDVPWQLLANINGIEDPVTVLPGTELKVVRGPFRAEVSLDNSELTLFMGDLYAGRFPIAVGNDPAPKPGTYTVQDKQNARTFYDASGSPVPANSPNNPYGSVWMDLGGQLSIHGSPDRTKPTTNGCVSLAGNLAEDLYGILSQGSSVTIRR